MFEPDIKNAATYLALGEFVHQFGGLETYLRMTLVKAIEADSYTGMFLVRKMDAKICLTKLRAVLKQRHRLSKDAAWLITECQNATDFRNKVAHTPAIIKGDPTCLHLIPFGSNIQKGQTGTPLEAVPNEQLTLAANFCAEASIDWSCLGRTLTRGERPAIAGRTQAAFPEGFPKYRTADQARSHKPDLKAYEVAHELSNLLAGDMED